MIPLPAVLSRSVIIFNSWLGVIGFQSLAQRSAPNTTMPRDCNSSRVAGVDSKPGKRKNGVVGGGSPDAVERHFNRRYSAVDLLTGLVWRNALQAAVAPGMVPDGMTL